MPKVKEQFKLKYSLFWSQNYFKIVNMEWEYFSREIISQASSKNTSIFKFLEFYNGLDLILYKRNKWYTTKADKWN